MVDEVTFEASNKVVSVAGIKVMTSGEVGKGIVALGMTSLCLVVCMEAGFSQIQSQIDISYLVAIATYIASYSYCIIHI